MEEAFDPSIFLDTDYQLEKFTYKEIALDIFCLKASTTDYDLTGQIIWKAAKQLSQFIIDNQETFKNKVVLELGAGAGLSGFVASLFAKKVVLTDGNEIVVDLLEKNKQHLNKNNLFVDLFLWNDSKFYEKYKSQEIFDVIIGADVLFWPQSIEPLADTLNHYFKINSNLKVFLAIKNRVVQVEKQFDECLSKNQLIRKVLIKDGEDYLYQIEKKV